jgi:hypothetical protein
MAVSMTVLMTIGVLSMVVVGEGASESVDPDPVVPTVGTNWRGSTSAMPMCCGLSRHGEIVGSGELDGDQTKAEGHRVLPRFGPLGRVTTYVLLV